MDGFQEIYSLRERQTKQHRARQRQEFFMTKRLENLLQNDVSYLIPQYINQDKVEYLQEIYELMRSGHHPRVGIDLSRGYFRDEMGKTENPKMRVVIMKLSKWINEWNEEDFEIAFDLCENVEMLESIVEYLQSSKSRAKVQQTEVTQEAAQDRRRIKSEKLLKQIDDNGILVKYQLIYCFLLLHYTSPKFDPTVIRTILPKIDSGLGDPENVYSAMFCLEYFLSFSSNFDLYHIIPQMTNFPVILQECQGNEVASYTLAFQICIDILYNNEEIVSLLIKKHGFIKILNKFLINPLLSIKAMWAFSNIIIFQQYQQQLLPTLEYLLKRDSQQNINEGFNHVALHQIQTIIINTLYSATHQTIPAILPLFTLFVPYIKGIFYVPMLKDIEVQKNILYALLKCLSLHETVRGLYLRHEIDKSIECFQIEHPNFETAVIEKILDELGNQSKEIK